ncbi:unnamed protein product [Onchocerca ochengi]|uniref:PX domain-containing protein n=2 Tax=Onchocerca TaxID=6281 RepID=A0A182EHA5_ONCOC|nr:unnamed protein product [Onchocerca ochengi]
MNMTSNQLIAAVATWHDIHSSLMKLGFSNSGISSDKITSSSSSTSSSYSSNSSISYINDDSLNGNYSSDESLDDKNLFNYESRLSISNLDLRSSQLKEMFPGLSEHWRLFVPKTTTNDNIDNIILIFRHKLYRCIFNEALITHHRAPTPPRNTISIASTPPRNAIRLGPHYSIGPHFYPASDDMLSLSAPYTMQRATTLETNSSKIQERRCSVPLLSSDRISTESSTATTFGTQLSPVVRSFSGTDTDQPTNCSKIIGKTKSLTNTSVEIDTSRNHYFIQHSEDLLLSKTSKKPLLIRSKAIDLPHTSLESTNTSSNNSSINTNSKIKHDLRPHLFVSFFAKHFEKMHKRMKRRPLGSSSSFDLDERQRMHILQQDGQMDSLRNNVKYPNLNLLHSSLNCFHCLIDASLREREFNKLNNGIRLWSSSDVPAVQRNNSSECSSEKFSIKGKTSLRDSTRLINK